MKESYKKLLRKSLLVSGNSEVIGIYCVKHINHNEKNGNNHAPFVIFCIFYSFYINAENVLQSNTLNFLVWVIDPFEAARWGIGLRCHLTAKSWTQISLDLWAFCVKFVYFYRYTNLLLSLEIDTLRHAFQGLVNWWLNWPAVNVSVNGCLSRMLALQWAGSWFTLLLNQR